MSKAFWQLGRVCGAGTLVLGGGLLFQSGEAEANPADMFGFGARAQAMGNAFTAVADDPFASYYNLGGLVQIKRPTVGAGLSLGMMSLGDPNNCSDQNGVGCSEPFYYTQSGALTTQQKRYGYDAPNGLLIGAALPLSKRLNFGVSTYLPMDLRYEDGQLVGVGLRLARFQTIDPYLPDYVMFQNRAQRFAAYAGLSYEVMPGLGVGVGTQMLANATMVMDINSSINVVNAESGTVVTTQINPLVKMDLLPKSAPAFGLFWNLGGLNPALSAWQLGLSYRWEIDIRAEALINADISVSAQLSEDEAPLAYGAAINGLLLTIVDHFTPHQASAGVSGLLGSRLRVSADVTWANWSAFQASLGKLPDSVELPLGMALALEESRVVDLTGMMDTFVPHVGVEGRLGPFLAGSAVKGLDLYLRGGFSYEPNPFPVQTGLTNLLNSDRAIGTLGLGMTTVNPFVRGRDLPVSLDFSAQYHSLVPTTHEKTIDPGSIPPDGYPVDGKYVSQGSVLQGGATLQLGF